MANFRKLVLRNLMTILIICGVVLGLVIGIVLRSTGLVISEEKAEYLGFPGTVLIRMLKFIATPLIVSCIICALGSMNLVVSGNITWQIIVVLVVSKFVVVPIGILICFLIKPGAKGIKKKETSSGEPKMSPTTIPDIFLDMVRNIVPNNMISVYVSQYKTLIVKPEPYDEDHLHWPMKGTMIPSINILGTITLAFTIGICVAMFRNRSEVILSFTRGIYEITMIITNGILWIASPLLFFLIMAEIVKIKDMSQYFSVWGLFVVTVVVTHLIIGFILEPIVLLVLARVNPFVFYGHMIKGYVTAFATSSSLATMPVVIECLIADGVDESLVRFVIPINTNINKDGAASLLAVCSLFVAQMSGESLNVGSYIAIIILSVMGSIAVAAVPFSAPLILLMILQGLGLDQSSIGTILALEWINDRTSTLTNVISNSVMVKLLQRWNRKLMK